MNFRKNLSLTFSHTFPNVKYSSLEYLSSDVLIYACVHERSASVSVRFYFSLQVQEAIAHCLPPLVPAIKDAVPEIMTSLLQLLLSSDNYGERKGAAYGLAGLVKGSGILVLKQLEIMKTLTEAVKNKKSATEREGIPAYRLATSSVQRRVA